MRFVFLVAVLAACGGRQSNPRSAGGSANDFASGRFVEIDFGEEEEALASLGGAEIEGGLGECGDLIKLETAAIVGQLSEIQIRCLDSLLRETARQTERDNISRVLLNDAWAKGDAHRWEGIARRHLLTIGQSDPDMCYKFAYFLMDDGGPDQMDEAIRWADIALENRAVWEGDVHVNRVFSLHKIKTLAAQRKWQFLESEHTRVPSEKLLEQGTEARNQTKTLAREWLEYARESGRDPTVAYQVCLSAAGTEDYCLVTAN